MTPEAMSSNFDFWKRSLKNKGIKYFFEENVLTANTETWKNGPLEEAELTIIIRDGLPEATIKIGQCPRVTYPPEKTGDVVKIFIKLKNDFSFSSN